MNRSPQRITVSLALLAGSAIFAPACAHATVGNADAVAYVPSAAKATSLQAAPRATEPYQQDPAYRIAVDTPPTPPAPEPAALPNEGKPYDREITAAAQDAGVEPALVHAVIAVESAYRPDAVSHKGAIGLMQVMPGTAQRYGISNPADVQSNLRAGSRHLRTLIDMFGDRLDLVLAAYNAGEGAVRKHKNAVPPYRETRAYVPAVLKRYKPVKVPAVELKASKAREYLAGTRLDPVSLLNLE